MWDDDFDFEEYWLGRDVGGILVVGVYGESLSVERLVSEALEG
jgi:hypothetical protein